MSTAIRSIREPLKDPELLDDIERAQDAMTVFENRPDLFEDAKRFREALGGAQRMHPSLRD